MIRPIRLTETLKQMCREALEKTMESARLAEGKFSFERSFKWEDELPKATVRFSIKAYLKMTKLVSDFSSEIGWNGIVHRDAEQENLFHIDDIVVCPQTVTGVTVDTDQERLEEWMRSLPIEVFNNMKLQGHSHVNMSVSPSTTDLKNWREIVGNLVDDGRDEFYIFMIWNKRAEHTVRVYDYSNNCFYDDSSVSVEIDEAGFDLDEFMRGVKESVKASTSSTGAKNYGGSYGGSGYGGSYGGSGYGSSYGGSGYGGSYGGSYAGSYGYSDDDDGWEDTPSGRGVKVSPSSNPQKPRSETQGKVVELPPAKNADGDGSGAKKGGSFEPAKSCGSCRYFYTCKRPDRETGGVDCKIYKRWNEK